MRNVLAILLVVWSLSPSAGRACGLSGPWHVNVWLSVFSPVGESAVEACRILRSDKIVIYCEIVSANSWSASPDNFILDDRDETLEGQWVSDTSATVVFTKQ